jgi:hypothetical protein
MLMKISGMEFYRRKIASLIDLRPYAWMNNKI